MALTDGLISYWKVDGNSTDSTGTDNGTDTNVTYTAGGNNGKINQGANFVGTGGINLSETSSLTNNFTFSFWMNCTNVAVRQGIFVKSDGVSGFSSSWDIEVGLTSGKITFMKWTGGTESRLTSTASVTNNTWAHVVCTYSGSQMKIIINDGTPATRSASGDINNITKATTWGRYGSYAGLYYTGALDEMGVWNRVLSAGEITELYNGGDGLAYPFTAGQLTSAFFMFFQ